MGDLGHTEPAHGAAEACAGRGGFPGRARPLPGAAGAGSPRWGPGPARPGRGGSGSAGSAHRAGGGECGRGAGAGLRAAGLVPGAQGAAPEMPQAGISRPACRDAGLEPRPAGLGRARAAGEPRPGGPRPEPAPGPAVLGWRTGVRGNFRLRVLFTRKTSGFVDCVSKPGVPAVCAAVPGRLERRVPGGTSLCRTARAGSRDCRSRRRWASACSHHLSFISALCSCFHE